MSNELGSVHDLTKRPKLARLGKSKFGQTTFDFGQHSCWIFCGRTIVKNEPIKIRARRTFTSSEGAKRYYCAAAWNDQVIEQDPRLAHHVPRVVRSPFYV